jgi:hypothetical protein
VNAKSTSFYDSAQNDNVLIDVGGVMHKVKMKHFRKEPPRTGNGSGPGDMSSSRLARIFRKVEMRFVPLLLSELDIPAQLSEKHAGSSVRPRRWFRPKQCIWQRPPKQKVKTTSIMKIFSKKSPKMLDRN